MVDKNTDQVPNRSLERFAAFAALATALASAQAEIGTASKDKTNPFFNNSKYADLASVWAVWQEVGPKNGLAVVQQVLDAGKDRKGILLRTKLLHKAGGSMSSTSFFPAIKEDPQAYGSALTYARRYSLAALVGVCPDDDDGNAAADKGHANGHTNGKAAKPENASSAHRTKLEKAYTENRDRPDNLRLIRQEADKYPNLKDIVDLIDSRIKELRPVVTN